jgi:hypothetical protein
MANDKVAAKPRIAPKNAAIKKVKLPAFADRASEVGPEGPWTQEQHQRMVTAFNAVPGISNDFTEAVAAQGFDKESWVLKKMLNSIRDWIGLPLEEINSDTLETLIGIVSNFGNKESLQAWATSKGLWVG